MNALLIHNPAAGQQDVRRELKQAVAYLKGEGWQITHRETRGPHDATTFAREAVAQGYQVVIVVGGDGTINEAINGLAGSQVALAVLPTGTGNVWALEVGIPAPSPLRRQHLLEAAKTIVTGQVRRIDLGRAGQRYFLMWAGIGLDAAVTSKMEPRTRRQKQLGALAYIIAGIVTAVHFAGTKATLEIDGHRVRRGRVLMALIGNAQLYGRILRLTAHARLDDGLLDVCIFEGYGLLSTVHHALRALLGRHLRDPGVRYYQARRIYVRSAKPMPVQVDGDPIGFTPMTFEVVPRALNVIVPPTVSPRLFEGGPIAPETLGERVRRLVRRSWSEMTARFPSQEGIR